MILNIGLQNRWVNFLQAPTLGKSVVASSGVSGEPVGHRLLHVGENLYKTMRKHIYQMQKKGWLRIQYNTTSISFESPWPAASPAQHFPSRQRSWLRGQCCPPSQSDQSWAPSGIHIKRRVQLTCECTRPTPWACRSWKTELWHRI